jgi:hypothetical protein
MGEITHYAAVLIERLVSTDGPPPLAAHSVDRNDHVILGSCAPLPLEGRGRGRGSW